VRVDAWFAIAAALSNLKCAAVLDIGGDPGCSEAVVTEFGRDAGGRRAPADHGVGVLLAAAPCG